jgi:hypothetical protein
MNGGNIDIFKFYIYKVDVGSTFPITPMGYNGQLVPNTDFYLFDNDFNFITDAIAPDFSTGKIIINDMTGKPITIQHPGYIICRRSRYTNAAM